MAECKSWTGINIRLDDSLHRELRIQAAMLSTTIQALTEAWIRKGLDELKKEEEQNDSR